MRQPLQIALYILIALLLSSCITKQKCLDKFDWQQRTRIEHREVQAPVPADSVRTVFAWDTLRVHDTVRVTSDSGRARVRVIRRRGDTVEVQANCKPDTVRLTREVETTTQDCPPQASIGQQLWGKRWLRISVWVGGCLIALGIGLGIVKKFTNIV